MHCQEAPAYSRRNWEIVEELREVLPDCSTAKLAETLSVKAVDLCDL
eukprot:CAMPEP_0179199294 /NCGR_PEP_ID=MMETSP0796-20121207/99149_1 /TAXON_ID=73915 /ORGANISM="Pyrodinium bahamense, Strain pbaha01" /LENGTH=46 /DNA_ID= /DNA_START= /DNA_END= /DNA_ORIENTATION=